MSVPQQVARSTSDEVSQINQEARAEASALKISTHAHAAKNEAIVLAAEANDTQDFAICLGQNDGVSGPNQSGTALLIQIEPRDRFVFVYCRDPHDEVGHEVGLTCW
jgi:hypothetical protein